MSATVLLTLPELQVRLSGAAVESGRPSGLVERGGDGRADGSRPHDGDGRRIQILAR